MMPVLIGVTPAVHEKFRNYKHSSSFREKSDAELLEYFLDSFEVITCILDLGARSSSSSSSPPPANIPDVLPFPTTPQSSQTSPTRERVPSARKSTPGRSKAKKSTSATCSRPSELQTSSESSPTPSHDSTAEEYVKNWRASIRRSIRISSSPSKLRSVRRKSIQSTGGPRKPPPLAIEPMPVVKTEPVDPSDVIEEQMSVPLADVLSKYQAKMNSSSARSTDSTPVVVPDSSVVPNSSAVSNSSVAPDSSTEDTLQVNESNTESYNADSIKKTLRLQCKTSRKKHLYDKAKETFEFDEPRQRRIPKADHRAPARSIAQLLVDAANYNPNSSQNKSAVPPTPSIPDQNNEGSTSNSKQFSYAGFLASSSDHSYSKKTIFSSQQKQPSSKPFILTIKPRGHKDVASAISSGKPIAPRPISVMRNAQTNACPTTTTANFNCSRDRTVAIKPTTTSGRNFIGPERQIGCNVCYHMFDTKADFQKHIKTVSTSKEFDPLTHRRIQDPNDRPKSVMLCKMCNTAFVDRVALEEHLANSCTIFPGASTYSGVQGRRVYSPSGNVTPTQNRTIRIFNVSQAPSQNQGPVKIAPATSDSPAQKRSLPDTPSLPKKRSSSDLFSQTCNLCNQKFCECLIANKKYKNNYQRKSVESAPKTDQLNFPFPFDLEATRAPVEKDNSGHRANNLSLASSHWEKLMSQAPERRPPTSDSDQTKSDNLLSKCEGSTVKLSSEPESKSTNVSGEDEIDKAKSDNVLSKIDSELVKLSDSEPESMSRSVSGEDDESKSRKVSGEDDIDKAKSDNVHSKFEGSTVTLSSEPDSNSRNVSGEDEIDKAMSDNVLSKIESEIFKLLDSEPEGMPRSVSGEDDGLSSEHKSKSSDLLQQLHEAINIPVDESSSDKSSEEINDSTEDITLGESEESSRGDKFTSSSSLPDHSKPSTEVQINESITEIIDAPALPANQLPLSPKASKLFKECYFGDPGKDIDSEPDIPDEALDTDDECTLSDSGKLLVEPCITDGKDEHQTEIPEDSDSAKQVEVKRVLSKCVQKLLTNQWTVDSDCEINGEDPVTDDELDANFTDAYDDQTSTEFSLKTNTDELLNLHKLFDGAHYGAQQHSQNLDFDENIALSISSDSEVDVDFSSDDECSLSNFDLTSCNPIVPEISGENELECVKRLLTSVTVPDSTPVLNQSVPEPAAPLFNDQHRLKARAFSINVCNSFLGDHAIKKKSLTLLQDRNLFCGPCQKHFKNIVSLDKHERKYHSLNT